MVLLSKTTLYFHFLQPNQYVDGSKPMGAEELARSASATRAVYDPVRHAYPLLLQNGAELKQRGVRFTDLTQVFARTGDPVYIDDCCHLNPDGTEILAQEISRTILDELDALKQQRSSKQSDRPQACGSIPSSITHHSYLRRKPRRIVFSVI